MTLRKVLGRLLLNKNAVIAWRNNSKDDDEDINISIEINVV